MINKNTIQKISDQEMDRKAFLKYSGIVLVSLVGLKGVVALLTTNDANKLISIKPDSSETARGFGGGKYGV